MGYKVSVCFSFAQPLNLFQIPCPAKNFQAGLSVIINCLCALRFLSALWGQLLISSKKFA